MPSLIEAIDRLITPARRLLLITHVAPDGDAIGSLLGLGWLLRGLGKEVTLACDDAVSEALTWLPGSTEVVQQASGLYDCAIGLDCSDRRRMGRLYTDAYAALPLIVIDHHVTNTQFGTVNLVDPASAATAQIVLHLADTLGWEVTRCVATCLLTGLVTDTRAFRTANVDVAVMRSALRLMEAGASLGDVTRHTLDQKPLSWVRLMGQAIDRLYLEDGILWTEVTRSMRQQWALGDDGTSGISNFLAGVREAQISLVFTERDDGTVDVGMRAVPGYDVAQVALELGGGGHPQASGCTLTGELVEIRELVLAKVRHSLAAQRRAQEPAAPDGPAMACHA